MTIQEYEKLLTMYKNFQVNLVIRRYLSEEELSKIQMYPYPIEEVETIELPTIYYDDIDNINFSKIEDIPLEKIDFCDICYESQTIILDTFIN